MQQYNSYNQQTQEATIVEPVALYLTHITYSQYKAIVSALRAAYEAGKKSEQSVNARQTTEMFSG